EGTRNYSRRRGGQAVEGSLQHGQGYHAGPAEAERREQGVPRPPLLRQGEATVDHQGCPSQSNEEAEGCVKATSPVDLSDLGFEVLTLLLRHPQALPTAKG